MSQPEPPQDVHALRDRAEIEERLARRQELVNGLRRDLAAHRLELENLRTTLATRDAALGRIKGNYQPACGFCVQHRDWALAALSPHAAPTAPDICEITGKHAEAASPSDRYCPCNTCQAYLRRILEQVKRTSP